MTHTKFMAIGLTLLSAFSTLSGCAAKALDPGAEKVIVSNTSAPKSCKFMGAVVGEQGGSFAGGMTSNMDLAQGALNDMRNKAHSLGANYVQLETHNAGVTGSGSWYSSHTAQTDVTNTGNAYRCPLEEIGL